MLNTGILSTSNNYELPCRTCRKRPSPCVHHRTFSYLCTNECGAARQLAHKRVCALLAAFDDPSSIANADLPLDPLTPPPPAFRLALPPPDPEVRGALVAGNVPEPFHQLQARTWLHNRPEPDVFRLLIDAYRVQTTDFILAGYYSRSAVPCLLGLTRFLLDLYRRAPDLLPPWWDVDAHHRCRQSGMRGGTWNDLRWGVGRGDVIRAYQDRTMSTQVAIFTELFYGVGPAGISTKSLLDVYLIVEEEERARGQLLWRRDEGLA